MTAEVDGGLINDGVFLEFFHKRRAKCRIYKGLDLKPELQLGPKHKCWVLHAKNEGPPSLKMLVAAVASCQVIHAGIEGIEGDVEFVFYTAPINQVGNGTKVFQAFIA